MDIYKTVRVPLQWGFEKFQGWIPDLSQMRLMNPKNLSTVALVATQVVLGAEVEKTTFDVFKYIDPLIGTSEGGHVFPGATLPFGEF